MYLCFVDLSKAYNSVDHTALVAILRSYGVPHQLVELINKLYTGTCCHVITAGSISEEFQVKTGVRQGCMLSPLLFNCVTERIPREATEMLGGGLHIEYTPARDKYNGWSTDKIRTYVACDRPFVPQSDKMAGQKHPPVWSEV